MLKVLQIKEQVSETLVYIVCANIAVNTNDMYASGGVMTY